MLTQGLLALEKCSTRIWSPLALPRHHVFCRSLGATAARISHEQRLDDSVWAAHAGVELPGSLRLLYNKNQTINLKGARWSSVTINSCILLTLFSL
jgi:hypothetical protein